MFVTELPDTMRDLGLEPVVHAGYATRGREFPKRPLGALRHWTVGGSGLFSSESVLLYGRPPPNTLEGPLCNVGQDRFSVFNPGKLDRVHIMAAGKANHAGAGHWPKGSNIDSNYELLGLEIEWHPDRETITAARLEVSERIMAGLILCCEGKNPDHAAEHREYAEPSGRKIDTNQPGASLRIRIREILAPKQEDVDMESQFVLGMFDAYFNLRPGTPGWTKQIVIDFNWHLDNLLSGRITRSQQRAQFAKAVGV